MFADKVGIFLIVFHESDSNSRWIQNDHVGFSGLDRLAVIPTVVIRGDEDDVRAYGTEDEKNGKMFHLEMLKFKMILVSCSKIENKGLNNMKK